jgi:hypothetical protein
MRVRLHRQRRGPMVDQETDETFSEQMPRPDDNAIIAQYPGSEQLLAAPASEVERILLHHIVEYCRDGMHPMVTRDSMSTGLFDANGYPYSTQARQTCSELSAALGKRLTTQVSSKSPTPIMGKMDIG